MSLINDFTLNDSEENYIMMKRTVQEPDGEIDIWKDYERCCQILQEEGIVATKYNYSNLGKKTVIIKLLPNRLAFSYEKKMSRPQGCLGKFFTNRPKIVSFKSLVGVMFGGATSVIA